MPHTSAILARSLCWDGSLVTAARPRSDRAYAQRESLAWQQLSQHGAAAEENAMPSPFRRTYTVNGKPIEVPKRARRLPPPNRLLEVHGLAGAIGEQLGLAWTAEQDVQRLVATRADRVPEHQRLVQRALAELSGHFVLGGGHSLANFTRRLLLLNQHAAAYLNTRKPFRAANGFPPGSDERSAWRTFNAALVDDLAVAAEESNNRFMVMSVTALSDLRQGEPFTQLDQRRGLDYHRRRPQSVEHISPRRDLVEQLADHTRFSMPAPALEPEANADAVHLVVVEALDGLRIAMRDIRRLVPRMIRQEGMTYIFD